MTDKIKLIKEILETDYGWGNLEAEDTVWFVNEIIKDVVKIVENLNDEL